MKIALGGGLYWISLFLFSMWLHWILLLFLHFITKRKRKWKKWLLNIPICNISKSRIYNQIGLRLWSCYRYRSQDPSVARLILHKIKVSRSWLNWPYFKCSVATYGKGLLCWAAEKTDISITAKAPLAIAKLDLLLDKQEICWLCHSLP